MPVYDKPMIYYPLSTVMLAGIRDILLITTPEDLHLFKKVLKDGSQFGVNISYRAQLKPNGLAEAFILGADFIGDDPVCLILGDNIFYGDGFVSLLRNSIRMVENEGGGLVFGYWVKDPRQYGVLEFDSKKRVVGIEEKPAKPKSRYAMVGLYFFDNQVVEIAKKQAPSGRGELEITETSRVYMVRNKLHCEIMGRGYAWLDAGTHDSLLEAAEYVKTIEDRQGLKISCPEEIAYNSGWIDESEIRSQIALMKNSQYSQYLFGILEEGRKGRSRDRISINGSLQKDEVSREGGGLAIEVE